MAALSNYLRNALMNEVFKNTNFAQLASVYVALYTTNPTAADTGTEVTGGPGPYARQQVAAASWNTVTNGATSNASTILFTGLPAATITHVGIRTALTSGSLLFYGPLTAPIVTNSGDSLGFAAGDLDIVME